MKKCAAVCGILFAVLLVCFAASVAATGVNSEGFRVSFYGFSGFFDGLDGTATQVYQVGEEFLSYLAESGSVKNIDLDIAAANVKITTSKEADMIRVYYKAGRSGVRFGCAVRNDTLVVRERGFFMYLFDFGGKPSELELVLPEREYGDVSLSAASGKIFAEELICKDFDAAFASGSGDFSVFAEDISLSAASGSVTMKNCLSESAEPRRVRSISLNCASGSHTVEGFLTDEFDIDLASGVVTMTGVSGEGDIDLASGNVRLEYAVWDRGLDIDAASGTVEVRLPRESGAFVELDAMSGGVTAELDGDSASFRKDSSGKVGGPNMQTVKVDLASGSVKLANLK